jgi:hypothetical protein
LLNALNISDRKKTVGEEKMLVAGSFMRGR